MKLSNGIAGLGAAFLAGAVLAIPAVAAAGLEVRDKDYVNQTTCNGRKYTYKELAGYGFVPSNARDRFGDTLGGYGSSIAVDPSSWQLHKNGSYTGTLYGLPDRGWNTEGTLRYQNRVHRFELVFTPAPKASATSPSAPNLDIRYADSVLLTDPLGRPVSGLDPAAAQPAGTFNLSGFPPLPFTEYEGDGFGGPGPGGKTVCLDTEGLVLSPDGRSFWISDEYGPYIYQFSRRTGRMIAAIQPPPAILPRRNGSLSFSADSPPRYDPNATVVPADPDSGRVNNQGLEGLTLSPDGRTLHALLQTAAEQDGGSGSGASNRNVRLVSYDVSARPPRLVGERVVPLPVYTTAKGKSKVAGQSEIHAVSDTQFFVLARDSGAGRAAGSTLSLYRDIDVFDISGATNIASSSADNAPTGSIVTDPHAGTLKPDITPAECCAFLDFNVNAQLARFGLHNGGAQDSALLNEKWESIAVVPVNPAGTSGRSGSISSSSNKDSGGGEVYVLSFSDNDFITQNGYLDSGRFQYKDESGFNVDNQALVFRVTLPH